jgi:hypothetical protein
MSNRLRRHPEDEQLLRYADGELPAGLAEDIRSHLDGCWECRTELQELQTVIGECVKYRKDVLQPHLPAPPAPWDSLYQRFGEIDASTERRSFSDHVTRVLQILKYPLRHAWRWAPAAAALVVILAVAYQYSFTPAVEAAELLRKASAAADLTPAKGRRLQIRTRTRRFTRPPRFHQQLAGDVNAQASVAALFQAAHYSWEDPLSARSYQAWRDQLSDKRDQVAKLHDAHSPEVTDYRIETTTRSSELTEATLTLSGPDLLPVAGRFEFRNHEWVEITEVAEDAAQPAETAEVKSEHPTAAAGSVPPPVRLPKSETSSTVGDELHILGALHELGADLGDPIEVQRSGGEILVTGVGIPLERQRQIQDVLGAKPNVVLRFSDAGALPLQPEDTVPGGTATSGEEAGLRARMENQLGGRRYVEQLTRQILEMSESMMSRAYALRRLAEQMRPGVEAELSDQDRRLLVNLYHDHTAVLGRQESEIERVLDPVLTSLGAPDAGAGRSPVSAGSWQECTEDLFQAARRVDRQLAQMLDVAPGEGRAEQLPAKVRSSLAELRARSEVCDRLTTEALGPAGR